MELGPDFKPLDEWVESMKKFGLRLAALGLSALVLGLWCENATSQGLPFGALNGEELKGSFQLESVGFVSVATQREYEKVEHLRGDVFLPVLTGETTDFAFQVRGSRLSLDRDRATTATAGVIPRDLGSSSVGPFFRKKLESGDIVTGDIQVGRSGIDLGSSTTATTVAANLFWGRKKSDDEGQWIYLLSYSNSRSSLNNIPFPGFAYAKSFKTETSQGVWAAGAPFFFALIRSNPWSFTSLLTPFTSFIDAGYSFVGPFGVFARFGWQPQGFKVNGGPAERILYEEFRTQIGLRGPLSKSILATVGFAYSDGRRVAWGDSLSRATVFESRLDDETSLFLSLSGRF